MPEQISILSRKELPRWRSFLVIIGVVRREQIESRVNCPTVHLLTNATPSVVPYSTTKCRWTLFFSAKYQLSETFLGIYPTVRANKLDSTRENLYSLDSLEPNDAFVEDETRKNGTEKKIQSPCESAMAKFEARASSNLNGLAGPRESLAISRKVERPRGVKGDRGWPRAARWSLRWPMIAPKHEPASLPIKTVSSGMG